jgi:Flp pilus assembly pilin Flp
MSQRARFDRHEAERGQGLAEYALILSLIAIVAILAVAFLGESLNSVFLDPIGSEITRVLNGI